MLTRLARPVFFAFALASGALCASGVFAQTHKEDHISACLQADLENVSRDLNRLGWQRVLPAELSEQDLVTLSAPWLSRTARSADIADANAGRDARIKMPDFDSAAGIATARAKQLVKRSSVESRFWAVAFFRDSTTQTLAIYEAGNLESRRSKLNCHFLIPHVSTPAFVSFPALLKGRLELTQRRHGGFGWTMEAQSDAPIPVSFIVLNGKRISEETGATVNVEAVQSAYRVLQKEPAS